MRAFGFLGTVIVAAIAMYLYAIQVKTLQPSAAGGNHEEVATIAGVKTDLLAIASAERGYQATEGQTRIAGRAGFGNDHHQKGPASLY